MYIKQKTEFFLTVQLYTIMNSLQTTIPYAFSQQVHKQTVGGNAIAVTSDSIPSIQDLQINNINDSVIIIVISIIIIILLGGIRLLESVITL